MNSCPDPAALMPRCSEPGCVFPACSTRSQKCLYHYRLQSEPQLFRSCQPTRLIVERARFGVEARPVSAFPPAPGAGSRE